MGALDVSDDRHPPARFNAARYCLGANAAARPDKTALVMVGAGGAVASLTFGEADRAVRGIAAGLLGLGLKRGDRVMIRMGTRRITCSPISVRSPPASWPCRPRRSSRRPRPPS